MKMKSGVFTEKYYYSVSLFRAEDKIEADITVKLLNYLIILKAIAEKREKVREKYLGDGILFQNGIY